MEVEAEELLRTHGPGAMQVVIDRIVAAVKLRDDQQVRELDRLLRAIEKRGYAAP
jgi:hypothetical protein